MTTIFACSCHCCHSAIPQLVLNCKVLRSQLYSLGMDHIENVISFASPFLYVHSQIPLLLYACIYCHGYLLIELLTKEWLFSSVNMSTYMSFTFCLVIVINISLHSSAVRNCYISSWIWCSLSYNTMQFGEPSISGSMLSPSSGSKSKLCKNKQKQAAGWAQVATWFSWFLLGLLIGRDENSIVTCQWVDRGFGLIFGFVGCL